MPQRRELAPHLAAQPRREERAVRREPRSRVRDETTKPTAQRSTVEQAEDEGAVEQDTSDSWHAGSREEEHDTRRKDTRGSKYAFKERGSIASRISDKIAIPSHSRVKTNVFQATKKREKKYPGTAKKVTRNIFIPSLVSVGNLARLLDVRLGLHRSQLSAEVSCSRSKLE